MPSRDDRDRETADELAAVYLEKTAAELQAADALAPDVAVISSSGDPSARVMLVKGEPGGADLAAGRVLAGPDGEAAEKALAALGLGPYFATCSRAGAGERTPRGFERLAAQIEAVDPSLIVALDPIAAEDVSAALGVVELPLGAPVRSRGRRILALEGLEASLGSEEAKARVWRQLQGLAR